MPKTSRKTVPAPLAKLAAFVLGPARTPVLILLVLAIFSGGVYFGWQYVRLNVIAKPAAGPNLPLADEYVVKEEQVHITPLPAWIHSNVLHDVFRDGSLENVRLSTLDDDLARRIANAFFLHPWIAKARVRIRPAGRVDVDLVYRRPVCMIEVPGDLLPVDIEGVLLPSGDFSPVEKYSYPVLGGIDSVPMGPAGQRWGDPRVIDGAGIAAALLPVWKQLRLYRIKTATAAGPALGNGRVYELYTRAGTRIYWGRSPAAKAADELTADEKVARLGQYAAEHDSLDGQSGQQELDVRNLPGRTPGR
ncbi:MAG: hypothetical protein ABSG68_01760 [Thermoguttaceae bacterium]|jgi:hypothetical protein